MCKDCEYFKEFPYKAEDFYKENNCDYEVVGLCFCNEDDNGKLCPHYNGPCPFIIEDYRVLQEDDGAIETGRTV